MHGQFEMRAKCVPVDCHSKVTQSIVLSYLGMGKTNKANEINFGDGRNGKKSILNIKKIQQP